MSYSITFKHKISAVAALKSRFFIPKTQTVFICHNYQNLPQWLCSSTDSYIHSVLLMASIENLNMQFSPRPILFTFTSSFFLLILSSLFLPFFFLSPFFSLFLFLSFALGACLVFVIHHQLLQPIHKSNKNLPNLKFTIQTILTLHLPPPSSFSSFFFFFLFFLSFTSSLLVVHHGGYAYANCTCILL